MPTAKRPKTKAPPAQATEARDAVLKYSPDYIVVLDPEGRCELAVNPPFGLPAEAMVGRTAREFLPAEAADRLEALRAEARKTRGPVRVTQTMRAPDGTARWFDGVFQPRFDDAGAFQGTVGFFRDVTEQRAMQAERDASAQLQRTVADLSPDVIVVQDRDLRYQYVSRALPGRTVEDMLGRTDREIAVTPEQGERLTLLKRGVMESRSPLLVVLPLRTADGVDRFYEGMYAPRFAADGEVDGLIGYFHDITEKRRTEAMLREREALFRDIAELTPDTIIVQDRDLRFEAIVNPRYGASVEAVIGRTDAEVLPSAVAELIGPVKRELLETGLRRHLSFEAPIGGAVRTMECDFAPRHDEAGRIIGVISYIRDVTDLRQQQVELRRGDERLRLAVEGAALGTWSLDAATWTLEWSERCKRHLGLPPGREPTHEAFYAAVHPEDRGWVEARVTEALDQRSMYEAEYRVYWPDGSLHWVRASGQAHVAADGRLLGMSGVTQDISDRKLAEEEITRVRDRLVDAQRIAHVGSFEYEAATQRTTWSEEEYRIYGLDPSGPSPEYADLLARCIHPDDAPLLDRTFGAAMRALATYELEHRIVRPDGSVRWVYDRAQPQLAADGTLIRYVGATLDITERKRAEVVLQQSEQRYRAVVRHTQDVIIMQDRDLRHEICINPGLGLSEEMALGRTDVELFPGPEGERLAALKRQVMESGEPLHLEFAMPAPSGGSEWFEGDYVPRRGADGRVDGVLGYFRCVTERKLAEAERAKRQSAYVDAVGRLAGGVAHELNNALQAISLNVGMATDDTLEPQVRESLASASQAIEEAAGFIGNLLDLSGKSWGTPVRLDLDQTVAGFADEVRTVLGVEHTLELATRATGAAVFVDPSHLRKVVLALVHNAREAFDGAGHLRIETTPVDLDAAFGAAHGDVVPGPYVRVTLTDTGRGMPPEVVARVFEPFYSSTPFGERPGLGLPVVRGLVQQYRGAIEVASEAGWGTTVTFWLPRAP